ncbi:hypothetical protein BCV69DRAFT_296181 [Microstroma glucosiphilum]|uniref:Uncharacterized protein n=1 Tax=Pseudomicrostroma glucosiphilum TaxID=1684307 RepID=A0A316UF50_9BASI|nr:hypothetical protein BCV69DRAFT_296181 [Pseudomicrostroma glucosiphilum]PWN23872.1 hypothetical protein BCV69DRAFT_296181 [Pseudomicrostroma glucosiphilum]
MSSYSHSETGSGDERPSSRGSWDSFASDEYVGSADYRRDNLRAKAIFVHGMQHTQCPPRIRAFIDLLTRNLDIEAIRAVDVEAVSALVICPQRDTAAALASQVRKYRYENKAEWMKFHELIFAALAHPSIARCEKQTFDVELGPSSDRVRYLAPPKPDLVFGLACPDYLHRAPSSCLDHLFLVAIRERGIQAFPVVSKNYTGPAFPCVLFEAATNFDRLMTAENRAAHGAAKALALMQSLRESYYHTVGTHISAPLPMVVICSQGDVYEVFIAFVLQKEEVTVSTHPYAAFLDIPYSKPGVHLVKIWLGNVDSTKMVYQLQLLLQRLLHWILQVWRPTIMSMLETIKASMSHSESLSNAFRASSTPSGHPKTFNYRRDNLTSASIYIHVLQERQLPFEIRAFVHAISHDIETDALAAAHAPTLPWRDSVVALAGQVAQYTLEHESTWMEFNRRVFSILENELLKRCQDIQFNVQVGPTAHRRHTLATPTPDLAFGLPTTREDESRGGLARDFLLCIPERFGIRPFPSTSPNTPDLVFPCIIFEAKSELGSIYEAQN